MSAGSVAREAAVAAAEAGSSLSGDARDQLEQASLGVARELRGELQRGQSDTSRTLSQIQPRLQVCCYSNNQIVNHLLQAVAGRTVRSRCPLLSWGVLLEIESGGALERRKVHCNDPRNMMPWC